MTCLLPQDGLCICAVLLLLLWYFTYPSYDKSTSVSFKPSESSSSRVAIPQHRPPHSPACGSPKYVPAAGQHHPLIAVLTYNRPARLNQTLHRLICVAGAHPSRIILFPDDTKESAKLTLSSIAQSYAIDVRFDDTPRQHVLQKRVATRYRFLFEHAFTNLGEEYVVVLEDDLTVSVDFVDYFAEMRGAMKADSSIFCVSAWNDNAYPATSADSSVFKRGEHFMALGWMISKRHYDVSVRNHWEGITDLRDWDYPFIVGMQSKDAAAPSYECVFPEMPR